MASDAVGDTDDDTFEATAVGAVTPSLDTERAIAGRERARNPFATTRLGAVLAWGASGVILGTVLAAAVVIVLVVLPADARHAAAMATTRAEVAATAIETAAADLRGTTQRIAESPAVAAAFGAGDEATIAALESRLSLLVDSALRVRINAAGAADIALTEVPPLTFAGLDLIQNAEAGQVVGPEFLATEAGPVLNVAAGIPGDGGRAVGSVMITFDARAITSALDRMPEAYGRFAVLQTFSGNAPIEVAATGSAGTGDRAQQTLTIPNWTLAHDPAGTESVASVLLTLPAWILALGAGLGLLVPVQRRIRRSALADLERLTEAANALALGRTPTSPRDYDLDEFAAAGAALVELSKDLETNVERKAPKAPVVTQAAAMPSEPQVQVEELEEETFLELEESQADAAASEIAAEAEMSDHDDFLSQDEAVAAHEVPPDVIFRDYDIRGIVDVDLTEAHARLIGRAIGSAVADQGEDLMAVAGDCRHSTAKLKAALIEGITAAGVDVSDLGEVPTPLLYHTTHTTDIRSGVIVTGSHNPPEYNGFKIVIGGETLSSGRIGELQQRIREGRFTSGHGSVTIDDAVDRYVREITDDIALAQPLRVVVDCGNGVAGSVMPRLLEALGCEVLPLYCDPDGDFPNHHPDPADPANLEDLRTVVRAEGADLGIALDGDGDRIGAVDEKGAIIWADRLMMLFSRDIVGRNPGADVIFDVKCSRHLNSLIAEYGGRPIMWKTGHAHLKSKMRETGALLGGELSGHISFGERWHGFDDGLYSAARLLEIVAAEAATVSELFAEFPAAIATPEIRVDVEDGRKFDIVEAMIASGTLDKGDVTTIDGLRVDYPDGWGLVRASNTAPALTLRFEADTTAALEEIAAQFREALQAQDASLDFHV